ncbi:MAG TPA: 16S rRNA (guanine(966)-N(2))-methyltransferase RsmD [Acidimicrobiales bacterium]|nr:16S rRNA (guanine(966)-N(2))-methyltransferase RsmD [Acidimicrobiales bacterium]
MRVVAGIARGRRLVAPKGDRTRPTSDFVREAIFNSLQSHVDLRDATVLDLFAGTGALGIEALSRGAAAATFVDHDRLAVAAVRANLVATGFTSRATVLQVDATRPATALPAVDVAFVDPPYAFSDDDWRTLLTRVDAGVLVVESDREVDPGEPWRVLKSKKYGTTVVTLAATPRSSP